MSISLSLLPDPPDLHSLAMKPSWVNNAGRIDRSACFELRASELRPYAKLKPARTFPRPGARNSAVRVWREAAGNVTVSERFLERLARYQLPLQLWGDRRTTRANVMKQFDHPVRDENYHVRLHERNYVMNPNKGATRTKDFGLYADSVVPHRLRHGWRCTVRIERWRLHERLARHFLLCPLPGSGCGEKMGKLFLVQAHPEEIDDAELALMWMHAIDQQLALRRTPMPRELAQTRATMIDRYRPILDGLRRPFLCRKCLGVRYGARWPR